MNHRIAGLLAILVLGGCSARAEPAQVRDVQIVATPVPLNPSDPSVKSRGPFTYVGGFQLKAAGADRVGGLSDLRIAPEGALVAVSDEGQLLRGRLTFGLDGKPSGLDRAMLEPLLGSDGQPLQGKTEGDSEGLAIWPNGDVMVSFERDHRIWIYPAAGGPPRTAPKPDIAMPDNEGMEGLTLAPSQGPDAYWVGVEGGSIWLCRLQGACVRDETQVRPPLGYRLTSLAETPTGDLAVLHHGWDPIRGSRIILWITRLQPGRPVKVVAKLALAKPFTIDNFEGVETQTLPGGGVRFYLISDDNFSPSQRTLLLAFDWKPPAGRRR